MTEPQAQPLSAEMLADLQLDVAITNEQLRLANILVASEFRGGSGAALVTSVLQAMAMNRLARVMAAPKTPA